MTVISQAEAVKEMAKMILPVELAWLVLPGKPLATKPDATQHWARVSFDHGDTFQASLANVNGKRRFRSDGVLMIEVHWPFGDMTGGYEYAQQFADVFEGKESASGIWFRNVTVRESKDKASAWFRLDVLIDFEYDRIK